MDEALAAISAAGYTEVEAASLPKKSAKEIRAALDKAGLNVSARIIRSPIFTLDSMKPWRTTRSSE